MTAAKPGHVDDLWRRTRISLHSIRATRYWRPFFLEGTKSLGYELWEDLGFRAPDNVVMPVGAGSSLLGCAFGFRELLRAADLVQEESAR